MNNIQYILSVTSAIILLSGCNSETPNDVGFEKLPVTVTAEIGDETRSVDNNTFDNNSRIGIIILSQNGGLLENSDPHFNKINSAYDYFNRVFTGVDNDNTIYFKNTTPYNFKGYYPYSGSVGTYPSAISINTSESQSKSTQNNVLDILISGSVEASFSNRIVDFTGDKAFRHVMSKLVFKLQVNVNDFSIEEQNKILTTLVFSIENLKHSGSFNLQTEEFTLGTNSQTIESDLIDVSWDNVESRNQSSLILIPQKANDVIIRVSCDDDNYKFATQEFPLELKSGMATILPISLTKEGLEVGNVEIKDFEDVAPINLGQIK